jgi:uroporphyrinogen decarboxylase
MGFDLEYQKGEGPVIHNPAKSAGDVKRVKPVENIADLGYVFEAVRLIRRQLPTDIPLLGFAGAPFTLASYAIEGSGSKNYVLTKSMMYNHPDAWADLMHCFTASLGKYLNAQIEAGCQAVQLFDSWAGCLSPADYRRYVLPHTKAVIDQLPADVPVINFLTGNPALLPLMREAGGSIMGIDWRVDLADAWETVGHDVAIQGNLDPVSLYADLPVLRKRVADVMNAAAKRPGHIFNLGHGVMPDMDPAKVKALVEMVHEMGEQ